MRYVSFLQLFGGVPCFKSGGLFPDFFPFMDYSVVKKIKSSIFGAKCFSVQIQTSALIMALGEITKCIIS